MLISRRDDHVSHQTSLEKQMETAKLENGRTVSDYARKLGITGIAVGNIEELLETGRFD
jgi:hypothetical protein